MERDSIAEEQTLLAVLDTGSFSAAAAQLGVSQSSVSRRIATLEARLGGARLIARTTRRVEATELGLAYAARIRQAFSILHDAGECARARGDNPSGLLRVSIPPSLGSSKLLPAMSRLAHDYQELEFDVFLSSRYLDLYEGKLDLAVRLMPFRRTDTQLVDLGSVPWVFAASPGYLRERSPPRRPAPRDFEFVVLNFRSGGPVDPETYKLLRVLARQRVRLRVNECVSLRKLLIDGHGVGLLPLPAVADDVRLGHLALVNVGLRTTESRAYAIYRRTLHDTAKVRVTIDAFRSAIAEGLADCQQHTLARQA
jgi:DNA-binding transcriptional LysR family regulator